MCEFVVGVSREKFIMSTIGHNLLNAGLLLTDQTSGLQNIQFSCASFWSVFLMRRMSKMSMIVVSVRLIFDLFFQGDKKERMFFKRPFYANELFLPLI